MATAMIEEARTMRSSNVASVVAYLGAAAFVIGSAWYGLATKGVTMAAEPVAGPHVPVEEAQRRYFAWFVTTLHQERMYVAIAILGFLCLAATATFVRDLIGRDRPIARIAAFAVTVGSILWVVGNVAHLGAHRAVGLLSTHDYSTETVSAVGFAFDLVDDASEVAGFTALGVGALLFARTSLRGDHRERKWAWFTAALGVGLLVTVASYLFQSDLTDILLLSIGVILAPAWLVWSGRAIAALGGSSRPEPTFRDVRPEHVVPRNREVVPSRDPEEEER
jgi:hypothetical protein